MIFKVNALKGLIQNWRTTVRHWNHRRGGWSKVIKHNSKWPLTEDLVEHWSRCWNARCTRSYNWNTAKEHYNCSNLWSHQIS